MTHLTRSKRDQIEVLLRAGKKQPEIAMLIGCSQCTVSRELRRNGSPVYVCYGAHQAQERAERRRAASYAHREHWQNNLRVFTFVLELLRKRLSPEQIEGRMKRESPWHRQYCVSAKSIYTWIWKNQEQGGCLYLHLRRHGKRPKWFGMGKAGRTMIPNRRDISERPKIVEKKTRCGDWESDLVIGGNAVATFVERFSRYLRAVLVPDRGAPAFLRAAQQALGDVPPELRLTLTHDNGSEICCHEQITEALNITVYCATPYHCWERGLNENTNGLLRDFFPKGTSFYEVSQEELDQAVELINNRPRRSLNFRTPKEVLDAEIKRYAFQISG